MDRIRATFGAAGELAMAFLSLAFILNLVDAVLSPGSDWFFALRVVASIGFLAGVVWCLFTWLTRRIAAE